MTISDVDGALLLVRLGQPVEGVAAEGIFEESEESARPLKVSLVNPPGHRVGQLQGHSSLPSEKERRGIKRSSSILPTNDALISPVSPFLACLYAIAEQIPRQSSFVKYPLSELAWERVVLPCNALMFSNLES